MKNSILQLIAIAYLFLANSLYAQSPDSFQYKWTSNPEKIITDSTYDALSLDQRNPIDLKEGDYSHIKAVKMIGTHFKSFPEVFWNNLKLEKLIIVGNDDLNTLEGIQTLKGLTFLMLELNEDSKLPMQLEQLTNLKYVVLNSSNGLKTDVPKEFFDLPNVEHLRLSTFREVPEELANFNHLNDLSVFAVQSLPNTLGKLERLETLRLSSVANIPNSIGALKVKLLEIAECKIDALPAEIGQMTELQELILNENHFSSLPSEIKNLTQLKTLKIKSRENFKWEEAMEYIPQLPQLKSLDMNGSLGLRKLPNSMKDLDQINQLKISSSEYNYALQADYINWEEAFALFADMKSLSSLHLGGNNIQSIPEAAKLLKIDSLFLRANFRLSIDNLENLSNSGLRHLDLSFSSLSLLTDGIGTIRSLQSIDLFRCKLKTLPDAMEKLDALTTLSLGNQQQDDIGNSGAYTLSTLPEVLFKMKSLKELNLSGNPKLSPTDVDGLRKTLVDCKVTF